MNNLEELHYCWVVTLYGSEEPIVTVFNNEDAAQKYYEYLALYGERIKASIDCVPIYSSFTITI